MKTDLQRIKPGVYRMNHNGNTYEIHKDSHWWSVWKIGGCLAHGRQYLPGSDHRSKRGCIEWIKSQVVQNQSGKKKCTSREVNDTPTEFTCCRCNKVKPWIQAHTDNHLLKPSVITGKGLAWCDDCQDKVSR